MSEANPGAAQRARHAAFWLVMLAAGGTFALTMGAQEEGNVRLAARPRL